MVDGFSYAKVIVDENENPIDYVYLYVNEAYERIIVLKRSDILGKRAPELSTKIRELTKKTGLANMEKSL